MESSPLTNFLANARAAVFDPSPAATNPSTLVLGNQSADLDSIVSAVVLSYCYTRRQDAKHRVYVPLINLPSVPSSELWRMRPEFGNALRLAQQYKSSSETTEEVENTQKSLLQHAVTLYDLQHHDQTKSWFPEEDSGISPQQPFDGVILVDHNAPTIQRVSASTLSDLKLTACIDHHVDESKVPSDANPRIITTGIGSCASLVVQHLRDQNLWPYPNKPHPDNSPDSGAEARELSILALAPILIDTANLTAPGKVSDTDRQVVSFLLDIIEKSSGTSSSSSTKFDISDYYSQISSAKIDSLDRLSLQEIFDQDYKEWTETPAASTTPSSSRKSSIKIGISCTIKPLTYLLNKAFDNNKNESSTATTTTATVKTQHLLHASHDFALSKHLDMHLIMTAFTAPSAQDSSSGSSSSFHRELFFLPSTPYPPNTHNNNHPSTTTDDTHLLNAVIDAFVSRHSGDLELRPWAPPGDDSSSSSDAAGLLETMDQVARENVGDESTEFSRGRVFVQGALGKSRKAVGPMVRAVAREAVEGKL